MDDLPALEVGLLRERVQALLSAEEVARMTFDKVLESQAEVEKGAKACARVEEYLSLPPPATLEELQTRDDVGKQLDLTVEAAQNAIERLIEATIEPRRALQKAEEKVLGRIDGMIGRLTELRASTVDLFLAEEASMKADKAQNEVVAIALEPVLAQLERFVQRRAEEVLSEVEAGKAMYKRQLDDLLATEAEYVRCSDVKNSGFVKVRGDAEEVRASLGKVDERGAAALAKQDRWLSLRRQLLPLCGGADAEGERDLAESGVGERKGWLRSLFTGRGQKRRRLE
jgi:hypothetical protein